MRQNEIAHSPRTAIFQFRSYYIAAATDGDCQLPARRAHSPQHRPCITTSHQPGATPPPARAGPAAQCARLPPRGALGGETAEVELAEDDAAVRERHVACRGTLQAVAQLHLARRVHGRRQHLGIQQLLLRAGREDGGPLGQPLRPPLREAPLAQAAVTGAERQHRAAVRAEGHRAHARRRALVGRRQHQDALLYAGGHVVDGQHLSRGVV
mmetsp:Transcript_14202/g.35867  ORF Transcript_14202/g.35867 Transcript_14202/m.35867 type:complete len:211 (-) Transcript_14202:1120-1752(-)